MREYITVTPAYGRDYKSKAAAIADWKAGKDFVYAATGQYCSASDFDETVTVNIRYKSLTMVCVTTGEKKIEKVSE